jgi:hypothetical protein
MEAFSLEKAIIGNVGLYLVASKLSEMGFNVATTSRNTKGCDLMVLDPLSGKSCALQVKTIFHKQTPLIMGSGRYDRLDELKFLYNFVIVKREESVYRYYIVPREDMKRLIEEAWKHFVDKGKHRVPPDKSMVQPLDIYTWQLSPYEEKWESIWA